MTLAKGQGVRLADVFFVGPVMVVKLYKSEPILGATLAALGVLTVGYNGRNYFRVERRLRRH